MLLLICYMHVISIFPFIQVLRNNECNHSGRGAKAHNVPKIKFGIMIHANQIINFFVQFCTKFLRAANLADFKKIFLGLNFS